MKDWWTAVIRDYFTFTKKERVAVSGIILIGIALIILPRLLPAKENKLTDTSFANEISQIKITVDTVSSYRRYTDDGENNHTLYKPGATLYTKRSKGVLFEFDPNTLDKTGWEKLGLRDKTIQTILNFTGKGYKFRQPADIKKIYGLHNDEAERLMPYIHIEPGTTFPTNSPPAINSTFPDRKIAEHKVKIIDINLADSTDFILLNGIGSKLAIRIINFRDKLGGFVSVTQIGETYGLPDSTFQKIKPLLSCDNPNVQTININSADAARLKTHPYIKWNVANAIVNYREQHGNYQSSADLKKINIIPDELYEKILPYVAVDK